MTLRHIDPEDFYTALREWGHSHESARDRVVALLAAQVAEADAEAEAATPTAPTSDAPASPPPVPASRVSGSGAPPREVALATGEISISRPAGPLTQDEILARRSAGESLSSILAEAESRGLAP